MQKLYLTLYVMSILFFNLKIDAFSFEYHFDGDASKAPKLWVVVAEPSKRDNMSRCIQTIDRGSVLCDNCPCYKGANATIAQPYSDAIKNDASKWSWGWNQKKIKADTLDFYVFDVTKGYRFADAPLITTITDVRKGRKLRFNLKQTATGYQFTGY